MGKHGRPIPADDFGVAGVTPPPTDRRQAQQVSVSTKGPADGAVAVDDVGGGQRQRARVPVVDALEDEAELVIDGGKVVGQVEDEAVLLGGVGADVAEDVEVEGVLRGEGEGLVGDLRGDGDEVGVARWRQSLRTVLGSTR